MDIAWNNKIGDTLYMAAETNLMKNYLLNLTVLKKAYQEISDKIGASFAVVTQNLSEYDKGRINEDLRNHYINFDFKKNIVSNEILNIFCDFWFTHGRFPGHRELTVLPKALLPESVEHSKPLSPKKIFGSFSATDARDLVSIQALCALTLYLGGSEARDLTRITM